MTRTRLPVEETLRAAYADCEAGPFSVAEVSAMLDPLTIGTYFRRRRAVQVAALARSWLAIAARAW